MKRYLVIGNPIEHSLSPRLHNHWIKQNNLIAVYEKKLVKKDEIKEIIYQMKKGEIEGVNITVPYKKSVIPLLDKLTPIANEAQSVNTLYKKDNLVIGDNTDVGGFRQSLKSIGYNVKNKKVFILGAGGVVSSIILSLKGMGASKIYLSNRTKEKAEELKKIYSYLQIIDWGDSPDFDMIMNATILGLKKEDKIELDYSKFGLNKLFYDIIYNPNKTNFLLKGEETGNKIVNGKMMFIYQAQLSFKIWHNILPKIDNDTIKLLDQ